MKRYSEPVFEISAFKAVSAERFEEHAETIDGQTGSIYWKTRADHLLYLNGNGDATIVLAYILNEEWIMMRNHRQREILRKNGMYFECPMSDLQKELGMWDTKIRRLLTILENEKIITTAHRWNNIVWITVNDRKLVEIEKWGKDKTRQRRSKTEDEADPLEQRDRSARTAGPIDPLEQRDSSYKKKEKDKNCSSQARNGTHPTIPWYDKSSTSERNGHHSNKEKKELSDEGNGDGFHLNGESKVQRRLIDHFYMILKRHAISIKILRIPDIKKAIKRVTEVMEVKSRKEIYRIMNGYDLYLFKWKWMPHCFSIITFCDKIDEVSLQVQAAEDDKSGENRRTREDRMQP